MENSNEFNEALEFFKLKPDYTEVELRKAYHPYIKKVHPDTNNNDGEEAKRINKLYTVLLTAIRNKRKIENEEEKKLFVANWKKDILALQKNYSKFREILNICKNYLQIIEKLETFDELKLQKEEFNEKIKVIKTKIYFQTEKDKFIKSLKFAIKTNKNDDFSKLAIYYLELTGNSYDLNDLLKLEDEYAKKVTELEEKILLQKIEETKKKFLIILKETSDKYQDQEIIDLVTSYTEKLNTKKQYEEINNLQKEFQIEFEKIRKRQLEFLKRKNMFKDYVNRYNEDFFHDLVVEYLKLIEEVKTIQEIDKLRSEFASRVKDILNIQKLKEMKLKKELIAQKEATKRSLFYYFYKASLKLNLEDIKRIKNVLYECLNLLNSANLDNIDRIMKFLSTFRFLNYQDEIAKLKTFLLLENKNFQNKDGINEYLNSLKHEDSIEEFNGDQEKRNVYNHIMSNFYNYAFSKPFEKMKEVFYNLHLVLEFLQKIDDVTFYQNMKKISKIDFRNMQLTKDIIDSLKMSNKVFISNSSGDLVTIDVLNSDFLIKPLDLDKGVKILSKEQVKDEYISVAEFFKKATFVADREVLEKINRYETRKFIYFFDRTFVYFYENLMLIYYIPNEIQEPRFEFQALPRNHRYVLSDNTMSTYQNIMKFKNRDYCENLVMKQINLELEKDKEFDDVSKK